MKKKRYQEGGEAEGISGTAGRLTTTEAKKPRTTDDMTFGQAFRAARNAGKSTFMWRGNKYTTETREEKKAREGREEKVKRDSEAASKQSTRNDAAMMMGSARRKAERAERAEKPATGRSVPFESDSGTGSRGRFGRAATESKLLTPRSNQTRASKPEKPKQGFRDRIRNYFEGQKKIEKAKRGYNRGGSIDGCAKRGKTRGKII